MKKIIDKTITFGLFPVTFCTALFSAYYFPKLEYNYGYVLIAITLATILILALFERIHPHIKEWNISQNDVLTDLKHGFVSMITLPQMLDIAMKFIFIGLVAKTGLTTTESLWPNQWNIFAQLALALLISQFGEYWVHRWLHTVSWMWPFHATHHSPTRLYWLNAARFHPVDVILLQLVSNIPLLLLGINQEVLTLLLTWIAVHGMFQHCNIKLKLGFLNYIFSMAELHRWHHSLKIAEANSNFGNNILLYDIIFGTVFYPKNREASAKIGLSDIRNFPKNYWSQITSPFRWKKILVDEENNNEKTDNHNPHKSADVRKKH